MSPEPPALEWSLASLFPLPRFLSRLVTMVVTEGTDKDRASICTSLQRLVVREALALERSERFVHGAKSIRFNAWSVSRSFSSFSFDSNDKGEEKPDETLNAYVASVAQVSIELLEELLLHLVRTIHEHQSNRQQFSSGITTKHRTEIVLLLLEILLKAEQRVRDTKQSRRRRRSISTIVSDFEEKADSLSSFGMFFFRREVVNLLCETVTLLRGENQLKFVRILSKLLRMRIPVDAARASILYETMKQKHKQQSPHGSYSPFLQALIELNVATHRLGLSKKSAVEDESLSVPTPEHELRCPSLPKHWNSPKSSFILAPKSTVDTCGIVYFLGTCGYQHPFRNPATAPYATVHASSSISSCDATSLFARTREGVPLDGGELKIRWHFNNINVMPAVFALTTSQTHLTSGCIGRFEGSNDGDSWDAIETEAVKASRTMHCVTLGEQRSFKYFRLTIAEDKVPVAEDVHLFGIEVFGNITIEKPLTLLEGRHLRYTSDMDENGLMYLLGTNYGSEPWQNPHDAGHLTVTSSSLQNDSKSASAIVGRVPVRCVTDAADGNFFQVSLKNVMIQPTHYTLRHYSSWDVEALRSWRLEASNDGETWTVLRVHSNDTIFRILMTGENSNHHTFMALSGFEVYGTVFTEQLAHAYSSCDVCLRATPAIYLLKKLLRSDKATLSLNCVRVRELGDRKRALNFRTKQLFRLGHHQVAWQVQERGCAEKLNFAFGLVPQKSLSSFDGGVSSLCDDSSTSLVFLDSEGTCEFALKSRYQVIQEATITPPLESGDIVTAETDFDSNTLLVHINGVCHYRINFSNLRISEKEQVAFGFSVIGDGVMIELRPPRELMTGALKYPPWFRAVLLVEDCIFSINSGIPLPSSFAQDISREINTWYRSYASESSQADIDWAQFTVEQFNEINAKFSIHSDESLVACAQRSCEKIEERAASLVCQRWTPSVDLLTVYGLEDYPINELRVRLFTLQHLNRLIYPVLRLVDVTDTSSHQSGLADGLKRIRGLLFWDIKCELWNKVLGATQEPARDVTVLIDRLKAAQLQLPGPRPKDSESMTVFGQCFEQLHSITPPPFRLRPNERAWKSTFVGEFGDDQGGLYRMCITDLCHELQSDVLPLLILCPNGRDGIGSNQDRFVPRPSASTERSLQMFEFLGKLMGLAIRSRELMSLSFPSIIWKQLVFDRITMSDVTAIDLVSFRILDELQKIDEMAVQSGMNVDDLFESVVDARFIATGSDQVEYPLVPGGQFKKVTSANRNKFAEALVAFRQNEFSIQCEAIKRGMATVIPVPLLCMFTWRELELMVCGRVAFDVDLLRKMTRYEGCTEDEPTVKLFWRLMYDHFDDDTRSRFLRFVWGRSRLPTTEEGFDRNFKLGVKHTHDDPDNYLPVAHTCFMQRKILIITLQHRMQLISE
ncbi:MAG: hypothetical protein MHM6MM_003301 [Cercozoa sp. M6MM]